MSVYMYLWSMINLPYWSGPYIHQYHTYIYPTLLASYFQATYFKVTYIYDYGIWAICSKHDGTIWNKSLSSFSLLLIFHICIFITTLIITITSSRDDHGDDYLRYFIDFLQFMLNTYVKSGNAVDDKIKQTKAGNEMTFMLFWWLWWHLCATDIKQSGACPSDWLQKAYKLHITHHCMDLNLKAQKCRVVSRFVFAPPSIWYAYSKSGNQVIGNQSWRSREVFGLYWSHNNQRGYNCKYPGRWHNHCSNHNYSSSRKRRRPEQMANSFADWCGLPCFRNCYLCSDLPKMEVFRIAPTFYPKTIPVGKTVKEASWQCEIIDIIVNLVNRLATGTGQTVQEICSEVGWNRQRG